MQIGGEATGRRGLFSSFFPHYFIFVHPSGSVITLDNGSYTPPHTSPSVFLISLCNFSRTKIATTSCDRSNERACFSVYVDANGILMSLELKKTQI